MMNKQSLSPTPTPKIEVKGTMTFPDAMTEVIKGKHVTKLEWDDKETYLYLQDTLRIHFSDGKKDTSLIVSDGDMIGMDWIVIG